VKTNVALIGFMGSGKSTIGKRLARRLKKTFIETDQLIEERAEKPIAEIFRQQGEGGFRNLEEEIINDITVATQNAVISCGGGIVVRPSNIDRLKGSSSIIYLEIETAALQNRLANSRKRPLLNRPDRDKFIEELHETRRPMYEAAADIVIKTGNRPFAAVISEIVEKLGIDESPNR
jgi:shikimate kinase